jgi:hypothetical protein
MNLIVFLRGVNVGGHKKFRPAVLAEALGMTNVGAAGTFLATGSPTALRAAIARALPFEADIMICSAAELKRLTPPPSRLKRFVSVLASRPRKPPRLPIDAPAGRWEVRIDRIVGKFALSLRRDGPRGLYPNEAVEKSLGVRATTRGWETIAALTGSSCTRSCRA